MSKRFHRVFISYEGSCPFMRDNRCIIGCAFFKDCTNFGMCCLLSESTNRTGYFTEQEIQPYGNYY